MGIYVGVHILKDSMCFLRVKGERKGKCEEGRAGDFRTEGWALNKEMKAVVSVLPELHSLFEPHTPVR